MAGRHPIVILPRCDPLCELWKVADSDPHRHRERGSTSGGRGRAVVRGGEQKAGLGVAFVSASPIGRLDHLLPGATAVTEEEAAEAR